MPTAHRTRSHAQHDALLGVFVGSAASHADRGGGRSGLDGRTGRGDRRQRGMALVIVMTVITMLAIYLSEMLQSTSTAFHVAASQRDRLQAEYIARSGLNLTRLLIAQEPVIRGQLSPMIKLVMNGRSPPQINVWDYANDILAPFMDVEVAKEIGSGLDFAQMEGIRSTGGTLDVIATPENGKTNVDKALFQGDELARVSMADQLFQLMHGNVPESPYDAMFERPDADGQYSTRVDIISALLDWWDEDQIRTTYEPNDQGNGAIANAGGEDDSYAQYRDPYEVKNTHFDSIEELRMVRGVTDDFWATFVESDPLDPKTRNITIYGSGAVNVNEAPADVLLARICVFVPLQPLCSDPMQRLIFTSVIGMLRIAPIGVFGKPKDFANFVQGKGQEYTMFSEQAAAGGAESLLFTPVTIPSAQLNKFKKAFITTAAIFSIQATGKVGRAEVRISGIVNLHNTWTPPPPNAGGLPALGVFHHYRIH